MPAAALTALADRLDVPVAELDFLAGYADTDLSALDAAVAAALTADDEAIQQGLEGAVNLIPRPLRGRAAKVLMPGGEA
jgi:hypothetical protein